MSLASLLLKGDGGAVDNELDSLFISQPAPPPLQPTTTQLISKSKARPVEASQEDTSKRKRTGSTKKSSPSSTKRQKTNIPTSSKLDSAKHSVKAPAKTSSKQQKEKKGLLKNDALSDSDDEEDDPAIEDSYLRRAAANKKTSTPKPEQSDDNASIDASSDGDGDEDEDEARAEDNDDSESEDEDYDANVPPPKHETADPQTPTRRTRAKKIKYTLPDETSAQRDARTVFIGNVSIDIVKSRPAQKQLKRYILQLVPNSKIESIRFRSVAFSAPTASLKEEKKPGVPTLSTKNKRQMERAGTWRKDGPDTKDGAGGKRKKNDDSFKSDNDQRQKSAHPTFTPAQRKRVSFYKQDFHGEMDSANAYVVFAYNPEGTPEDSSTLHPAEAARLLAEKGNGTAFMSRTLRMDRVGQWRVGLPASDENYINLETSVDPHCTLFVGNLDFATKEEDLRSFFDTLVSKERNEPPVVKAIDEASSLKKRSWVKSVRIIRDRDTQLGKGFAYVRFIDRECVDEVLVLEPESVKFAKRKLRLQKCKGVPGATPKSTPIVKSPKEKSSQTKTKINIKKIFTKNKAMDMRNTLLTVPKGDPNLGVKLASLSKEERKAVKSADAARLERRLAKKRAKSSQSRGSTGEEKLENKQRHRQRKSSSATSTKPQSGSKKGRMRSENSLAKRNMKK